MTRNSNELMIELLRLVYKYGPEEFDALAREFDSAQFKNNLPRLLEEIARESRRNTPQQPSSRSSPAKKPASFMDLYRDADPEKYKLLKIAHSNLRTRALKPSELTALARSLGLLETGSTRKKELVERIIRRLSTKGHRELQEIIKEWFAPSTGSDALNEWSKIILPKGNRFE